MLTFDILLTLDGPWVKNGSQNFKKIVSLCGASNYEDFYSNIQIQTHYPKILDCLKEVCKLCLQITLYNFISYT